jgi:hypothetical protein
MSSQRRRDTRAGPSDYRSRSWVRNHDCVRCLVDDPASAARGAGGKRKPAGFVSRQPHCGKPRAECASNGRQIVDPLLRLVPLAHIELVPRNPPSVTVRLTG